MADMALISNFFVHGKPLGGESTATNRFHGLEERITEEFFRSCSSFEDKSFMICEVRKWKDVFYSAYSLFKDGYDKASRPNGYCVLTLVVEGVYCIMPSRVYELLEFVYKRGLQESLQVIDNGGHHLISSYSEKKNEFDQLAKEVYERLDEKDFREIDFSISVGVPKVLRVNPVDADCESSLIVLRRHEGNLLVSKDFSTVEQKMMSLRKEPMLLQQELVSLNEKNKSLSDNCKSLSEKNESLQRDVALLRKQLAKVNGQEHPVPPSPPIGYEELRKTRDTLKELANKIREMLDDFKNRMNPEPDSGSLLGQFSTFIKTTFRFFPFLNSILLCVCLCGIFFKDASCSFKSDSTETIVEARDDEKEAGLQQKIEVLKENNRDLSDKLNISKKVIEAFFKGATIKHSGSSVHITSGETVILSLKSKFECKDCSSVVVWEIVGGKDFAQIEGDSLKTIKAGTIKVCAYYCGVQIAKRDIDIK